MLNIGIVGYGNLGKGVEKALCLNKNLRCSGIFTRREPKKITSYFGTPVYPVNVLFADKKPEIDSLILCGGSAKDLPQNAVKYAAFYNTIDAFDTHTEINEYYRTINSAALKGNRLSLIAAGWDPGILSSIRLALELFLLNGQTFTFWGKGVSQGHSNAIKQIQGVKHAIAYTIPVKTYVKKARIGLLNGVPRDKLHKRKCFVVANKFSDKRKIEKEIKGTIDYFNNDTIVKFLTETIFNKKHKNYPHGGKVIRSLKTTDGNKICAEFSIKTNNNPFLTGCILAAYASALDKMYKEGKRGAVTVFDIPFSYLFCGTKEEMIKKFL